ncbi:uncharacterized protein LOC143283851 [Babylonia areolata]|uniref:uncharacterized protein LOC143283851 n=1 Tax=Babylonia areolata TaxID=304850 RepID=UPI003FD57C43
MNGALVIATVCVLLSTADCPEGWLRSGDFCYWVADRTLSFEDGHGLCASQEATLVSLATPGDLNATLEVARASGVGQVWTCLLYDPHVQAWTWLDGATYTSYAVPWWGGTEPPIHAQTRESCAALDPTSGRMHLMDCVARAAPACRRSAYKRELCNEDDGWKAIGTSCYKLFNDKQTWIDADKTCFYHSATLLPLPFSDTVRSVIQQSVICDTSDNDVWISTVDVPAPLKPSTMCNWVSVLLLQDYVQLGVGAFVAGLCATGCRTMCNWVSVMYNQILIQGSCLKERKFICQKPQGSCAEGWQSHEGRCYHSPATMLPWFSADRYCKDLGAAMLTVSDEGEQNFVKSQMISGTFAKQIWLSVSGSATLYMPNHWAPGYSQNFTAAECAFMMLGRTDAFWATSYCYRTMPFVCEMSRSDSLRNVTHPESCETGWHLQGGRCYLQGDNKNYTEAESYCHAEGGFLATVHTSLDQSNLAVIISGVSEAWIGLRRYAGSKRYTWIDDGTTVSMPSNWLPGRPDNNTAAGRDCVQVVGAAHSDRAGAWTDMDCSQRSSFICQRAPRISSEPSKPGTSTTAPWSWRCGEGWLLSPTLSSCFLLVTEVTVPWAAARAQCLRHGADLVSVTSFREQTLVEALVRGAGLAQGGGAWSGLWIGATDNTREGGWEWSDSAPFRFLHWSAGQPDNSGWGGEEQDCAVVVPADTLQWDDRDCDELHNYICKKTAVSVADSMLVASSSSDDDHGPEKSRLFPGNTAAWMADAGDKTPWVGVHLETLVTVRAVQTTGSGGGEGWVTMYQLRYRYDSSAPAYWYTDFPGSPPMPFFGNNDTQTPVTHLLGFSFAARQVYLYPLRWSGPAPTLRWELLGCLQEECVPDYAISGPLVVPSPNLTASSVSDPDHDAASVRMNPLSASTKLSCWRPLTSLPGASQWIQADFERVEVLRGVSTRGNPGAEEWVRSYLLLFHPDGLPPDDQSWEPYDEPYGTPKVFTGNVDNNSTVTNYLKSFIPTQRVRLQPQSWHGHIALQFDVLVCEAGCEEQPLLAGVSDEQLSATSSEAHHGPQASRLSTSRGDSGHQSSGGWQAQFSRADQFIQVKLNLPQEVRAVATRGRQGSNHWVKAFYLSSSMDAKNWTNYTDSSGNVQVFPANFDPVRVRKHYLTPFLARYVRLHPALWEGAIGLQWELYGCPGKNGYQAIGCFTDHPNDPDLPYEPYTDLLNGMDPMLCSRHCFNKGYSYAGTQARSKCYCGNSFGRYGPSPDCNLKCNPRTKLNCGGMSANYVYTTGLSSEISVCPAGWKRLKDQCYYYVSNVSDWRSARAGCASLHADLTSVSDPTVNQLLYSLMGTATGKSPAWIGLNDLREDRYFEWSDEEEVVYTDWDLHQPAPSVSGESRHCVAINNKTGGWVSEDCGRRLPYLCRTNPRPSSINQSVVPETPEGCQQGMLAYSAFCYTVVEENRTLDAARDVCTAFGGKLLVVSDSFEQAFLASMLSSRSGLYWTDVSDLHNPGLFTYEQGQYDVMYTNWDSGMPDSHRYGHCVALAAGRGAGLWRNQPCSQALKAICKLPRDNYPEPALPARRHASNCSTNWVETNSSLCYQINQVSSNLQRSWAEARADCKEQRGELASFVNTPFMETFWRYKLLGSSNHYWIGLHAVTNGGNVYGARMTDLAWSDRSAVTLDGPWSEGQPDSQNGTRTCVELHAPSGTLALQDCSLPRNWLCALPSAGSCAPLDDSWKRYRDFCFRVSSEPATWRQARHTCQVNGADLASITNVMENEFILSLAQKTPQSKVWIGLNELMSAAGFYGSSGGTGDMDSSSGGMGDMDSSSGGIGDMDSSSGGIRDMDMDSSSGGMGDMDSSSGGMGDMDSSSGGIGDMDSSSGGMGDMDSSSGGMGDMDSSSGGMGDMDSSSGGIGDMDSSSGGIGDMDSSSGGIGDMDSSSGGMGDMDSSSGGIDKWTVLVEV